MLKTSQLPGQQPHTSRALRPWAICALACTLMACALLGLPAPAAAEQRLSDVVCGQTAEDRGLATDDLPDLAAAHAIVVGADGTVYFERDADAQTKIASITKVMTAIVALENADLSTTITVDHAAATVGESTAHLQEGDTLSLETALRALLIPSGNDAAMAIATTVGAIIDPSSSDPYATFIQAMNDKAAELGMGAVFTNPHGLDFGDWVGDMHASARDVATMFSYAMQNETFREIDGSGDNTITVTGADGTERQVTFKVRNDILGQEGNIGGKTGGTYDAGTCFVGAFQRDGEEVFVVVLGCEDNEARFANTLVLADWYYAHKKTVPAITSPKTTPDGELLVARATDTDWTDKTVDVVAADPHATITYFDLEGDLELTPDIVDFSGAVTRGEDAGTLTVSQGDTELASLDLLAAEDVAAPSPLEWLLVQFDRLTRMFTGEPGAAEQEVLATTPGA